MEEYLLMIRAMMKMITDEEIKDDLSFEVKGTVCSFSRDGFSYQFDFGRVKMYKRKE